MKKKGYLFRICAVSLFSAYFMIIALPNNSTVRANAHTTQIATSKAECVMEINSRRVLYEERGDIRLPMASTTKIATCITVLERCNDLQTAFVIPQEAVGIEGSSVYLQAGETYTVEDLLYGLMLRSGNDCATALALYCSGSVKKFTTEMNKTAQKAGALQSNFQNPHGLPHKNHYTTARDLSLISAYAMQNPAFEKIVASKYYEKRHWKNKNKMLTTYEGGIGVKTGYTKEAGRCLVSAAKRDGMTLVCTVLNSPHMFERSAQLLDDAFAAYSYIKILEKGAPITIAENNTVTTVDRTYAYPLLKEEIDLIEIQTKAYENKNVKTGEIAGEFEIYLAKRLLFSGNLYKL